MPATRSQIRIPGHRRSGCACRRSQGYLTIGIDLSMTATDRADLGEVLHRSRYPCFRVYCCHRRPNHFESPHRAPRPSIDNANHIRYFVVLRQGKCEYGSHIGLGGILNMGIREARRLERQNAVLDAATALGEEQGSQ